MRIELERSAALAWSPNGSSGVSPLFAVGTVEGTMDASFDTSSVLELYSVHEEQGRVEQVARVESSELFTRLAWMHSSTEGGSGLLTGAHGNGQLTLWDAAALQRGEPASTALRVTAANHTRPLTAIDANPMLKNLLATAAAEELIVWDLAQLDQTPVTHHPTAQHPNFRFPVSDLAWNRCVPRIMATTSTAGSTVIWDMRSQKPVKTLPPDGVPLRCRALAWSPNQATMLATSSEDDSRPVIQLWDLRRAVSPVIDNMSGHRAGIRSLSWCADDANLLLSSGMDQRTLLWNVNSGCVLDEVDSGAWNFDVSWAIGCRSMFSCCQQGKVVLHTVHDYNPESRSQPAAANAAAAEQDPFAPAALPLPNRPPLGPAPAWLGRPAGVCFGFGGRLVSFSQQNVQVHRLQTDQSLVAQARSLDAAIDSGEFEQFCEKKAADAHDTNEQNTWRFLRAQFASNPRQSFLCELGFGNEQIQAEIDAFLASLPADSNDDDDDDDNDDDDDHNDDDDEPKNNDDDTSLGSSKATEETADVYGSDVNQSASASVAESDRDDASALQTRSPSAPTELPSGASPLLTASFGEIGFDAEADPFADLSGGDDQDDPFSSLGSAIAPSASPALAGVAAAAASALLGSESSSPLPVEASTPEGPPIVFPTEQDAETFITRALLTGNLESAVECCTRSGRMADALVLAWCGGADLFRRTQAVYLRKRGGSFAHVLSPIVNRRLDEVVRRSSTAQWRHTLAALLTYCNQQELPSLCGALAARLRAASVMDGALVCYLCEGNVTCAVDIWLSSSRHSSGPLALQTLVEKCAVFRNALKQQAGDEDELQQVPPNLAAEFANYACELASQGELRAAARHLAFAREPQYSGSPAHILLYRIVSADSSLSHMEVSNPFVYTKSVSLAAVTPASVAPAHVVSQPSMVGSSFQGAGAGPSSGGAAEHDAFSAMGSEFQYGPSSAVAGASAPPAVAAGSAAAAAAAAYPSAPAAAPGMQPPVQFGQPAAENSFEFGEPATTPSQFGQPTAAPAQFGQPTAAPAQFGQPTAAPAQFGQPIPQPTSPGQFGQQPSLQPSSITPTAPVAVVNPPAAAPPTEPIAPAAEVAPASQEALNLIGLFEHTLNGMQQRVTGDRRRERMVEFARHRCEGADGLLLLIRSGKLSPSTMALVSQFLQFIQANQLAAAAAIHKQLSETVWEEVGSLNMGALKRLIEASK